MNLKVNGLEVKVVVYSSEPDDIWFELFTPEGHEITDEEVYQYVRDNYHAELEQELIEQQIAYAESYYDSWFEGYNEQ